MNSHERFDTKKRAFTLIETVITLTVFVSIAGLGLFFGVDQYRGYILRSERDLAVSLLQKARARAMSNIDQSSHGFKVQGSDYVLFEGNSYGARNIPADQIIPKSGIITASGMTEVVFTQLSGEVASTGNLTLTASDGSQTININNEGRIDW